MYIMTSILIIEQNGEIKETKVKTFDEKTLYKKAGFKTDKEFKKHVSWKIADHININVYGRTTGRANTENKYEFPPPIDNTLFFGRCVIVKMDNDEPENLKQSDWKKIYETLCGGFEDIGNEDSEESEDDVDPNAERTKSGYVKDAFIVDDDEIDEANDESDEENSFNEDKDDNSSIDTSVLAKKRKQPTRKVKTKTTTKTYVDDYISTDELTEEEYV